MDLQLTGKHVLVTGGSRGIGLACAREFLREGARVSLAGRSTSHLDAALAQLLLEGHSAAGFSADLTDAGAALTMLDQVRAAGGPVDVLVNSALTLTDRLAEGIAKVVVFLCSPRAGYVSGAIVSMDGAATPLVV